MEQRKCRRCGHPMTRIITQTIEPGGSHWKACYTCLSCGHKIVAAPARSRAEAEKGLEDFAAMIDQEYKTADRRSAAPTKPDRLLKVYDLYCQLCETLTGEINPEPDVLRNALQKAKRELEAYKGAGQRYEAEIARLKRMAAEDILRAARWGSPCDSCVNVTKGDDCDKGNCEYCENHCVCQECNYSESFVWRGAQEEKPKARGGKLYAYPIILTEEENGAYSVLIPDFGCATCGKDEIEARLKAAECIVGRMIAMRDDNEPFPAPAEMTDGLLRESCVSVGTDPGKAFWALSLVQMEEEH